MIELSASTASSTFAPMGLVSSPTRSVSSSTSTVVVPARLHKYPCQELDKLKHKYRLQHTSCLTHLQTLLSKHRVRRASAIGRATVACVI